ncbi:MAG: hypothetical protein U5J64_11835 [Halobacteriales archaeon]|nr:hypothetical protein [Halobacteriales archaeon]
MTNTREDDGKTASEPPPSVTEMEGIHEGRYDEGEVLECLREMKEEDKRAERVS